MDDASSTEAPVSPAEAEKRERAMRDCLGRTAAALSAALVTGSAMIMLPTGDVAKGLYLLCADPRFEDILDLIQIPIAFL